MATTRPTETKYNFNGEQCALPAAVLATVEKEWNSCLGVGVSMLEMFNKQPKYLNLLVQGEKALRELVNLPAEFRVYTMSGGQALQNAAVPLNLLGQNDTATYVNTGYWSERAIEEAKKYVPNINVTQNIALNSNKRVAVSLSEPLAPNTAYIHYVSDEVSEGIALNEQPTRPTELAPKALVVADLSGDFLTREIDWSQIDVAYVSSEYQIGVAGSVVLLIRDSAILKAHPKCPYMIDYSELKANDGIPNTPGTFPMYINAHLFLYAQQQGSLSAIAGKINQQARSIYAEIDAHPLVYETKVAEQFRSNTHIVFKTKGVQQDQHFIDEAALRGIIGLQNRKGDSLRISLNLGTTDEAVKAVVAFLAEYAEKVTAASLDSKTQ